LKIEVRERASRGGNQPLCGGGGSQRRIAGLGVFGISLAKKVHERSLKDKP